MPNVTTYNLTSKSHYTIIFVSFLDAQLYTYLQNHSIMREQQNIVLCNAATLAHKAFSFLSLAENSLS